MQAQSKKRKRKQSVREVEEKIGKTHQGNTLQNESAVIVETTEESPTATVVVVVTGMC